MKEYLTVSFDSIQNELDVLKFKTTDNPDTMIVQLDQLATEIKLDDFVEAFNKIIDFYNKGETNDEQFAISN